MVSSRYSGQVIDGACLAELPLDHGDVRLDCVPGSSTLLMAQKSIPRRFFSYDTGSTETLIVDLGPDFDATRHEFVCDRFPAIGLQIASMRILYLSRTAQGEVRLKRRPEKHWLRPSREVYQVSAQLRFQAPVFDRAGFGEVTIDWHFSVPVALLHATYTARPMN